MSDIPCGSRARKPEHGSPHFLRAHWLPVDAGVGGAVLLVGNPVGDATGLELGAPLIGGGAPSVGASVASGPVLQLLGFLSRQVPSA